MDFAGSAYAKNLEDFSSRVPTSMGYFDCAICLSSSNNCMKSLAEGSHTCLQWKSIGYVCLRSVVTIFRSWNVIQRKKEHNSEYSL